MKNVTLIKDKDLNAADTPTRTTILKACRSVRDAFKEGRDIAQVIDFSGAGCAGRFCVDYDGLRYSVYLHSNKGLFFTNTRSQKDVVNYVVDAYSGKALKGKLDEGTATYWPRFDEAKSDDDGTTGVTTIPADVKHNYIVVPERVERDRPTKTTIREACKFVRQEAHKGRHTREVLYFYGHGDNGRGRLFLEFGALDRHYHIYMEYAGERFHAGLSSQDAVVNFITDAYLHIPDEVYTVAARTMKDWPSFDGARRREQDNTRFEDMESFQPVRDGVYDILIEARNVIRHSRTVKKDGIEALYSMRWKQDEGAIQLPHTSVGQFYTKAQRPEGHSYVASGVMGKVEAPGGTAHIAATLYANPGHPNKLKFSSKMFMVMVWLDYAGRQTMILADSAASAQQTVMEILMLNEYDSPAIIPDVAGRGWPAALPVTNIPVAPEPSQEAAKEEKAAQPVEVAQTQERACEAAPSQPQTTELRKDGYDQAEEPTQTAIKEACQKVRKATKAGEGYGQVVYFRAAESGRAMIEYFDGEFLVWMEYGERRFAFKSPYIPEVTKFIKSPFDHAVPGPDPMLDRTNCRMINWPEFDYAQKYRTTQAEKIKSLRAYPLLVEGIDAAIKTARYICRGLTDASKCRMVYAVPGTEGELKLPHGPLGENIGQLYSLRQAELSTKPVDARGIIAGLDLSYAHNEHYRINVQHVLIMCINSKNPPAWGMTSQHNYVAWFTVHGARVMVYAYDAQSLKDTLLEVFLLKDYTSPSIVHDRGHLGWPHALKRLDDRKRAATIPTPSNKPEVQEAPAEDPATKETDTRLARPARLIKEDGESAEKKQAHIIKQADKGIRVKQGADQEEEAPKLHAVAEPVDEGGELLSRFYNVHGAQDLSHEDIPGLVIDNCKMKGSNLARINAKFGYFLASDLRGADFMQANLQGVQIVGCDLRGARFDQAKLQGATFIDCKLGGASFNGAIFVEGDESRETLCFAGCNMNLASFEGAYLKNALFSNCVCIETVFDGADLTWARFTGCVVAGASFKGATIKITMFQNSTVVEISTARTTGDFGLDSVCNNDSIHFGAVRRGKEPLLNILLAQTLQEFVKDGGLEKRFESLGEDDEIDCLSDAASKVLCDNRVPFHDGWTHNALGRELDRLGLYDPTEERPYLRFPYREDCTHLYVTAYSVTRHYGGPEEGGWYDNLSKHEESALVHSPRELYSEIARLSKKWSEKDRGDINSVNGDDAVRHDIIVELEEGQHEKLVMDTWQ